MSRPLFVGEANPRSSHPRMALFPWPRNSAGGRLAALLDVTAREYLMLFERVNLFPSPPSAWSTVAAARAAGTVLGGFPDTTLVLMLGARVAAAFGMADLPLWHSRMRQRSRVRTRFVRLPHPSGRSRTWNDPVAQRALRRTLRRWTAL
jgi:hypothetical protein